MALLPPFYLDTVVAIGVGDDLDSRRWIGTGFIVGKPLNPEVQPNERKYSLWLVTNKHVLKAQTKIYIKFNSANDPDSIDYPIDLNVFPWFGHENNLIDVATIKINHKILEDDKRKFGFIQLDEHKYKKSDLKNNETTEGDRIFVLGFPMGLVTKERQYVVCRGGYIARIRDYLEDRTTDFLIDASVFPGNSGGPVIICPEATAITGTKQNDRANLIGIVKSYIAYQDAAVSPQTGRTRIVFEENTGLASVESVDSIIETILLAEKILGMI